MLEYILVALVIIGLGVMAFFLTKAAKAAHEKRAALAEEKGWEYEKVDSKFVMGMKDSERNIRYRLRGNADDGTAWEMTGRYKKNITSKRSSNASRELPPSTEWHIKKPLNTAFLIMPSAGFNLPDFALQEIFRRLNFPANIPRLDPGDLPQELAGSFDIFSGDASNREYINNVTPHLSGWSQKHPGQKKGIIMAAGPDGLKMRVDWLLDKPEDIEAFVNTGLSLGF